MDQQVEPFLALGWLGECAEGAPKMEAIVNYLLSNAARFKGVDGVVGEIAEQLYFQAELLQSTLTGNEEIQAGIDGLLRHVFDMGMNTARLEYENLRPLPLFSQGLRSNLTSAKRMAGLNAWNAESAQAQNHARERAAYFWEEDITQSIRMAEMSEKVYREMMGGAYKEYLPGFPEGIRAWIKPIAPHHASKRGRSKK